MIPARDRIEKALEKAKAATPGPWKHERHENDQRGTGCIWQVNPDSDSYMPNIKCVADVRYSSDARRPWSGSAGEEFESTSEHIAQMNPAFAAALLESWLEMEEALVDGVMSWHTDGCNNQCRIFCKARASARAKLQGGGE